MINKKYVEKAIEDIGASQSEEELENLRVKYLGRKSKTAESFKSLSSVEPSKRKKVGSELNQYKDQIEQAIETRSKELFNAKLSADTIATYDPTAPGVNLGIGHLHPVVSIINDLSNFFVSLGFDVASGPEVETEWYCFEALNIPKDHPARDMQDTFYLEDGRVPRTHTSSVQIRYMENNKPPIRVISPGKVYRNEDEDATHLWAFQQLEGLVVGEDINLSHLKGTLLAMVKSVLGEDTDIRLRPNYFPYVEPAVEIDVRREGEEEWVELLGAGMVHPQVLRNVNIDPDKYTGFAFGVGIERLAIMKYGIGDVRHFWRPDLRFLEQF